MSYRYVYKQRVNQLDEPHPQNLLTNYLSYVVYWNFLCEHCLLYCSDGWHSVIIVHVDLRLCMYWEGEMVIENLMTDINSGSVREAKCIHYPHH